MTFPTGDAKSDLNLLCPVCSQPLTTENRSLLCAQGHQFDMAKEGYVNLLMQGQGKKRPKFLGDTKQMFQARRAFLEKGHYQPLADLVSRTVSTIVDAQAESHQTTASTHRPSILDAGCGEGYYLRQVEQHLKEKGIAANLIGMDIAKDGPRMAARWLKEGRFFVADVNQPLLFPDGALDLIMNIFAPRNSTEFVRVLSPRGCLLVVIPMENHLAELRYHIDLLEIQDDKANQLTSQMSSVGLHLAETESLSFAMQLAPDDVRLLVEMTPNHRHMTAETWKTIDSLPPSTEISASFQLLLFKQK